MRSICELRRHHAGSSTSPVCLAIVQQAWPFGEKPSLAALPRKSLTFAYVKCALGLTVLCALQAVFEQAYEDRLNGLSGGSLTPAGPRKPGATLRSKAYPPPNF